MTKKFKQDCYTLKGKGEMVVKTEPIIRFKKGIIIINPETTPKWKLFLLKLLFKT